MTHTVMTHYLACSPNGWGCTNGHVNANFALVFIAVAMVIALAGMANERWRKRHGLPPRQPRPPRRNYYPTGMYAHTPSGIRVKVRCHCPAGTRHRTPDEAVRCGLREKARIERVGR
jgi:hypothetical protein